MLNKRGQGFIEYLLMVSLVVIVLIASDSAFLRETTIKPVAGIQPQTTQMEDNHVVDHGNGVYYFPYIGKYYAEALSKFIEKRKDLVFVSEASDNTGLRGSTFGYIVVFRQK
ncbi:MAG: hypothetical protein UT05_C0009G0074 [Parcubacteria group bacterium GW2011_GWF2_38_76]|nr:MAG: hypothetical protein UT05_C0009G0074 [Parcubacteria group bacterium GW2011_GWF2_38_76]HBM45515.1 hypothetical protein [Patescibacteria group bacterium]